MSVSQDPTVELWRHAAIELLAASHALSAASNQPWRADPGAGWWVLGDVAVALEAVLVLDTRLEEVGVLSGHDRSVSAMGLAEQRMVLSQTARVAGWEARTARLPTRPSLRCRVRHGPRCCSLSRWWLLLRTWRAPRRCWGGS